MARHKFKVHLLAQAFVIMLFLGLSRQTPAHALSLVSDGNQADAHIGTDNGPFINSAFKASLSGGLSIPPGTFRVTGITLTADGDLSGAGEGVTTLMCDIPAEGACINWYSHYGRISGITLKFTYKTKAVGIFHQTYGDQRKYLKQVSVLGTGSGIGPTIGILSTTQALRMEDVTVGFATGDGVQFRAQTQVDRKASEPDLMRVKSSDNGGHGISFIGTKGGLGIYIYRPIVTRNGKDGIHTQDGDFSDMYIVSAEVSTNQGTGIYLGLGAGSRVSITGLVESNGVDGIYVGVPLVSIRAEDIQDNGRYGINIDNLGARVNGAEIRVNHVAGIAFSPNAGAASIVGNFIDANPAAFVGTPPQGTRFSGNVGIADK